MPIGYLINPFEKTVTQVEYKDVKEMNQLIGGRTFCIGYHDHETGDTLYVDDEGLFREDQKFFIFAKRLDQPLAGNGLLVGREVEDSIYPAGYITLTPEVTISELKKLVMFERY